MNIILHTLCLWYYPSTVWYLGTVGIKKDHLDLKQVHFDIITLWKLVIYRLKKDILS